MVIGLNGRSSGVNHRLKEHRIFLNVYFESHGGPPSTSLYEVWQHTLLGEIGSTSSVHGLASYLLVREELPEPLHEPGTSRDGSSCCDPQGRMYKVSSVTSCEILAEDREGVEHRVVVGGDDNFVPLKSSIGLVCWQKERVSFG